MDGRAGLVMGHEFGGVVEDAGGRPDLSPGQRVTVIPLNPCGECATCRQGLAQMCVSAARRPNLGLSSPGAYAEFVSVRPDMVRALPEAVSDLEAAMIEPAAVSFHAVRSAGVRAGDRVLITGGGAIGLLCAAWCRISGAAGVFLSEVNGARSEAALKMGDVHEVLDGRDPKMVSRIRKATSGGVDVAIDASASESGINSSLMSLKPGGTLVLAGISLLPQSLLTLAITGRELVLKGSFGYTVGEFETVMDFIGRRAFHVDRYISRTVSLEEVQQAFEDLQSGCSADVKIVIRP
jgi:threonine dehydrogenase-like Zn-dependent dehydrogenase